MKYFEETLKIAEEIYYNPELGFKENRASTLIKEYLLKYFPEAEFQTFAKTGIKFNLKSQNESPKKNSILL